MSATTTPRRPSTASTLGVGSPTPAAGPSRRAPWSRSPVPRRMSTLSAMAPPDTPGSSGSSRTAASGRYRRRAALAGEKAVEGDWAGMEPDEVFRRLPVVEVKRVEGKMRADALNKQSELRSMVGTRYRDLLTSASQITSLHSSSLRLSSSLKSVGAACANPTELVGGGGSEEGSESDDVNVMLPAAAHVKLLLDAPEALYSYLSRHDYLEAAFLWLVARVVKDGLNTMPEDVKGPYQPLVKKQWEVLLPFRSQIVQRATAALRSKETLETKTLSETLLAIILLDSLPLGDALDLLLSQRLKALRDDLAAPIKAGQRRRSSSRVDAPAPKRKREDIAKLLGESVQCLLEAERLARAVFEPRRKADSESVIAEAIRLVQAGEEQQTSGPQPLRRASGQRRTSRMSISLPMPPRIPSGAGGPPVSVARVLRILPSSQILLRYLPPAVIGFTPFIAPSPAPSLEAKLAPWHASAMSILHESVPAWLDNLSSVADVWAVRDSTCELLQEGTFQGEIRTGLEAEWSRRVQALWTAKLDSLVISARSSIEDAAKDIRAGKDTADNDPESHMFADIAFPTAAGLAAGGGATFNTFLGTLKKRATFRTPQIETVLGLLERAASDIKNDLSGLPEALYDDYRAKLGGALDALLNVLRDVLADAGGHRDAKGSVEAELFVGRVALYLANSSEFLGDLAVRGVDLDLTRSSLLEIHAESTVQWQTAAVEAATRMLSLPSSSRAEWQGEQPSQPSASLVRALTYLVGQVRHLGIPAGMNLPVVPALLRAFVKQVRTDYQKLEGYAAAQGALDTAFCTLLLEEDITEDEGVSKLLAKLPSSMSSYSTALPALALEAARRTQLILHPLIQTQTTSKPDSGKAALMRLGAPALRAGVGAEFKSPIAVARPGKRFGLLSIVA